MSKPKDYLTKLFSDFDENVSPEELENQAQLEAQELIKQQTNFNNENMYIDDTRYFADNVEDGNGLYAQSPEEEQVVTDQHEAEVDPEVFVDADGQVAEVEHTDMEGNPIHPEVVKQALYEEYIYNKYYADTEDDEDDEEDEPTPEEVQEEVVKQALLEEYAEGRLFTAGEVDEYVETVLQSYLGGDESLEPMTYFYADSDVEDEDDESEGKDVGKETRELTEDDAKPAVEVVDEATKKQSNLILEGVNKLLTD